jgi:two-component system, cell cycle sensor histidine kinase and response regulator CckA
VRVFLLFQATGTGGSRYGYGVNVGDQHLSAEALWTALCLTLPNLLAVVELDGRILKVNRLPPEVSADQVLGKTLHELTEPNFRGAVTECLREVARTLKSSYVDVPGAIPGLRGKEARLRMGPVVEAGVVRAILVIVHDNTLRKETERALREQDDKLRVAVDAARLGLWSCEFATQAVTWDGRTMEAFGATSAPRNIAEFMGFVHPEDRALLVRRVEEAREVGTFQPMEHRVVRPSGEVRWIFCCARVVHEGGTPVRLSGGVIDITDKRTMDAQLRFAQKSEAVGQLSSGLAHNFNNMLAGMLPVLDMVERKVEEPWRSRVQSARHAGERAAEMVRQLMTFARPEREKPRGIESVRALSEQAVRICQEAFGARLAIELHPGEFASAMVVRADGGQIEQVLVNLLLNARDAVAHVAAPAVQVELSLIREATPEFLTMQRQEGVILERAVRIRVSDNGSGMTRDIVDRVFEPFFTTKAAGAGTGLGLATAHAIVRDHGGFLTCESVFGFGTKFDVYLPLALGVESPSKRSIAPSFGSGAKVLIVDDDATIRAIVADVLAEAGYRVSTAEGAEAAFASIQSESPDVVMLDHSMPGALGSDVAHSIRKIWPRTKIVRFSGHSEAELEGFVADAALAKPASRDQILDAVERAQER